MTGACKLLVNGTVQSFSANSRQVKAKVWGRMADIIVKEQNINLGLKSKSKIFFIHIGELAKKKSLVIIENLLEAGLDVMESLGKESLRSQLKVADKFKSPLAVIFGQQEAFEESIIIRDMKTGAQETVPLAKVVQALKRRLK